MSSENVYMSKPLVESYREMVECMEKVLGKTVAVEKFSVEDRDHMSMRYIKERRDTWRRLSLISSKKKKEASRANEDRVSPIKEYLDDIEAELRNVYDAVLKLLDSRLIPSSTEVELEAFYLMMKGDFHGHLAEFKTGAEWKEAVESALEAYKSAQDMALEDLAPVHPVNLELALNFSVFYFEILNSPDRAYSLAKEAFDEASLEYDMLGGESLDDCILPLMQLLQDNCTLFLSYITEDAGDEIKAAPKQEAGEGQ